MSYAAPVPTRSDRPAAVADSAVRLLAELGMRGLTHRAVDTAAALPPGSTSNYARTRAALVGLAVQRMAELELAVADAASPPSAVPVDPVEAMVEMLAALIHLACTSGRALTLARYEVALEANRRPELRAAYDRAGRQFRERGAAMLAAAGSTDPVRHARAVAAWGEGMIFGAVAGADGGVPDPAEVRVGAGELLRGLLGR